MPRAAIVLPLHFRVGYPPDIIAVASEIDEWNYLRVKLVCPGDRRWGGQRGDGSTFLIKLNELRKILRNQNYA